MLLARHAIYFAFQHTERADDAGPCFPRFDYVIDEAVLGGDEWISKPFAEFFNFLPADRISIRGGRQLPAVHNVHCSFGAHHRNFRGWPGEIDIRADVLGTHDAVGATV